MRAPDFWDRQSVLSTALLPLAALYRAGGRLRWRISRPFRVSIPVICVGNLVAGGAGKTPVVLTLVRELKNRNRAVHVLTRGYGGRLRGPVMVDPASHAYPDVGDEALLLAAAAPTWVARDRAAGARAALRAGADVIVMDDGFQNPGLHKDLSLIVVDGRRGFGNGRIMPAGPLRESVASGLARAQGVIVMGEDVAGIAALIGANIPFAQARIAPLSPDPRWPGRRVVALAGIGEPRKFFETLRGLGAEITAAFAFPDHHPYQPGELATIMARAAEASAVVVTTAKDGVRLPPEFRTLIEIVPVDLVWRTAADAAMIGRWLDRVLPARP